MKAAFWNHALFACVCIALSSCGGDKVASGPPVPESYWSAAVPANAQDVFAVRENVKDGQELTVIGLVQDYRERQAQFFVADRALIPCNERPGNTCRIPWDYCCEDKLRLLSGLLTVELRDGKTLRKSSLAGFHGFDRLQEAIVKGKAEVDEAGNVILVASALHVREPSDRASWSK